MNNKPNFNCAQFRYWAEYLRNCGHEVFSPEEHTRTLYGEHVFDNNPEGDEARTNIDRNLCLSDDIDWLINEAEALAVMPGWRKSRGAVAERAIAIATNKKIIDLAGEDDEYFEAVVTAIVGDGPGCHYIMMGPGDGTCQRWKVSDSQLRKLWREIMEKLDFYDRA